MHAVSERWGNDQLQHERHLVHQCHLQKHRSTLRDGSQGRRPVPKMMLFGNVTSSGTTAIWECRYSWSVLLSTHLRLHAVAGKIESTVSEIVRRAHSYVKKDPAAPPAAAAPCCYLNYKRDYYCIKTCVIPLPLDTKIRQAVLCHWGIKHYNILKKIPMHYYYPYFKKPYCYC